MGKKVQVQVGRAAWPSPNPLTIEMRRKAKRFAVGRGAWANDDELAGALLEMFAVGLAAGAELATRQVPILRVLVETADAAKKLTGGVQYFASKPKRSPKKRRK